MIARATQTLFFDPGEIAVARVADESLYVQDQHLIPLEAGVAAVRELGVLFLAGADELVVDAAQFEVNASSRAVPITPSKPPTAEKGKLFAFAEESRLRSFTVTVNESFSARPTNGNDNRLILRSATPSGAGYVIGPPLFALPPFDAGAMYGAILGGMSITGPAASKTVHVDPAAVGRAFLVQVAKGRQPTELVPQDVAVDVLGAEIETLPRDLTVTLHGAGEPLPVWSHPGVLPAGAAQPVTFRPMAEKLLNERLAAANAGSPPRTLGVALHFTSSAASEIAITAPSISATYHARPSDQPRQLALRGSVVPLPIDAPAAVVPRASTLTLAAKFLGRELNGAYETVDDVQAASGLRVHSARSAAACVPLRPLQGSAEGTPVALASVRLSLVASSAAEVVVELREAASGAPGALLAPQSVRQLDAAFRGWCEIELQDLVPIPTGPRALWIVLRATKGEVLWACDAGDTIPLLASTDAGVTWGDPAPRIASASLPRIQLFHAVVTPPSINVDLRGDTSTHAFTLTRTGPASVQFTNETAVLPPAIHNMLAITAGTGRATTALRLSSRSAIDLTVDALTLSYNP